MSKIFKRPVCFKDRDLILKLLNEKKIRKNSLKTKKISIKENENYWKKVLKQKNFKAYIIKKGKNSIGLVRIKNKTVSIAITKSQENKGIGFRILSEMNLDNCYARIKKDNKASKRLFEKLGFTKEYETFKKQKAVVAK